MNTKDLMERIKDMSYTDVNEIIQKLAQPDIVYCGDCESYCEPLNDELIGVCSRTDKFTSPMDYCSEGEKR